MFVTSLHAVVPPVDGDGFVRRPDVTPVGVPRQALGKSRERRRHLRKRSGTLLEEQA